MSGAPGAGWLFFDLDGTLVDSIPLLRRVFTAFWAGVGIPVTDGHFDRFNGYTVSEIVEALCEEHGLREQADDLRTRYLARLARDYASFAQEQPGATRTLEKLAGQGWHLALVTSGERELVEALMIARGWENIFTAVVWADSALPGKPHAAAYLRALELTSADPRASWAVEDSPNGVVSAKTAGLPVVGVALSSDAGRLADAGADLVVAELEELCSRVGTPRES